MALQKERVLLLVIFMFVTGIFIQIHYQQRAIIYSGGNDIRRRQLNDTSFQTYNDLTIVNYNVFEMMSGYSYFGIIDFDEFLIPAKNMKLKKMLNRLFRIKRGAAGFKFMSQYFYLSWGPTGAFNDMILGRYLNTTVFGPDVDKEKLIYKPTAIEQGGITTHRIWPKENFNWYFGTAYTVPKNIGFIRHYRNCRTRNAAVHDACMYTYKRVEDKSMARWSRRIKDRVQYVRKQVFGSSTPSWKSKS